MKSTSNNLSLVFVTLILIAGMFFRFYQLGQTPSGLYVDEASLGYNAYSVLKTGKDEYGKTYPVLFRSFATFQSSIYSYLLIPFVSIFDLSVFSVRLPSAIFGSLSILILYLLIKNISPPKYKERLAVISALLLAVSPWHIQYSRTAYEANIALFFLLLGSLFFFYSLKKPWVFVLSSIAYVISIYSYRAEMLIVPVLITSLTLRFWKDILADIKMYRLPLLISCILGAALILPLFSVLRTPGFQARTSTMNIFSESQQTTWGYINTGSNLQKILNTPILLSTKEFFSLYSSYFSPRYIFSLGDAGPRKPLPDLGTFFAWQFPLYVVGLYFLFKEKGLSSLRNFVFVMLVVTPVPAALTRDPYSTLRSLPMVVPLVVIMSLGLTKILDFKWSKFASFKYVVLLILLIYSCIKMFISIFYHHDFYRSVFWNYGWAEVMSSVTKLDPNLPVVVDNSKGDTYIELLFLLKYNPEKYQKENFEVLPSEYYTNMSRNNIKRIGRFTVKNFQWGIDTDHVDQYIIADNIAIGEVQIKEHGLSVIDEIRLPSGEVSLRILRTNPKK